MITPRVNAINELPCEERNRLHAGGTSAISTPNLRRDARSIDDAANFMNNASLRSLTLMNNSAPQEPKNNIPEKMSEKG